MSNLKLRELVDEFLALVREGKGTPEQAESSLRRLLDALAFARHQICVEFDETEYPDTPDSHYPAWYTAVCERFPGLGYYNAVRPVSTRIGEAKLSVGDAIDDIADIARDLAIVAWAWRNTSEMNALWHFEESFRSHWGCHLRDLQQYLHARASESGARSTDPS